MTPAMTTATHLPALVSEHLEKARSSSAGRSATTVYGGREHALRQTLIALAAGQRLGEHESPGEATLQVLQGTVVLHAGDADPWTGSAGDHAIIPLARHDLEATEDAAVLLTVALEAEHKA